MANAKTVVGALQEYVPYYLAKYVDWYMTPEDRRCAWEDLAKCDVNFKTKEGTIKTPEFAEENWLQRQDVQEAIQAYLKYFKKLNLTMLYQNMLNKALAGDVKAADWVVKFSESEFFNDEHDEVNDFLSGINIPGLQK
jgi:hypothetical protein